MKTLQEPAAVVFERASDRGLATLRMLIDAGKPVRLAMLGTSMLPLLHEPMVLELGPVRKRAQIGDVLVFAIDGKLCAHRIVGLRDRAYITAGDTYPLTLERVEPEQIVGKVVAAYADASTGARRVDGYWYRVRGQLKARTRGIRVTGLRMLSQLRRLRRGLDAAHRPRAFVALLRTTRAILHADRAALSSGLERVSPDLFLAAARRHKCASIVLHGMHALDVDLSRREELVRGLRISCSATALKLFRLRTQIIALVSTLRAARIDFALLKGAARIYGGEDEAFLHYSVDIDVLVKREDVDAGVAALLAAGYFQREMARTAAWYKTHHHHLAPFAHRSGEGMVEVHVALAPPSRFSRVLGWSSLSPYFRTIEGPAGEVRCLNDVGTAVHLASHAIGLRTLRDVVIVAQLLQRMDSADAKRFRQFVDTETVEPVRLAAVAAMAARLAGVAWEETPAVRAYLQWIMRREDLPAFMRTRSGLIDARYAGGHPGRRLAALVREALPKVDARHRIRDAIFAPARIIGRVAMGGVAYLYAKALPSG